MSEGPGSKEKSVDSRAETIPAMEAIRRDNATSNVRNSKSLPPLPGFKSILPDGGSNLHDERYRGDRISTEVSNATNGILDEINDETNEKRLDLKKFTVHFFKLAVLPKISGKPDACSKVVREISSNESNQSELELALRGVEEIDYFDRQAILALLAYGEDNNKYLRLIPIICDAIRSRQGRDFALLVHATLCPLLNEGAQKKYIADLDGKIEFTSSVSETYIKNIMKRILELQNWISREEKDAKAKEKLMRTQKAAVSELYTALKFVGGRPVPSSRR